MAKVKQDSSNIYRFMCITSKNTNYHIDFNSKSEALSYIDSLNDPKIEWYGLYEIYTSRDYMHRILSKRIKPYNDTISVSKESPAVKVKKRKNTT